MLESYRPNLSKASNGALLIELRKARVLLEESERAALAENNMAMKPRLERLGTAIAAVEQIEQRMEVKIKTSSAEKTGGKNVGLA